MEKMIKKEDLVVGMVFKPTSTTTAELVGEGTLAEKGVLPSGGLRTAFKENVCLIYTDSGQFRKVPTGTDSKVVAPKVEEPKVDVPEEVMNFQTFIQNSGNLKPELLKMDELKWKYLVRSVMRGKNIMMTGPAGSGKTFAVQQLTKALNKDSKRVKKQVTKSELEALKKNMKVEIHTTHRI